MTEKFEALPNRMMLVEEVERFTRVESIEEVSPVSVIQEHRLVSSFVVLKGESVYALGFDEDEEHWVVVGTFDRDERATALRSANRWIQAHYDDAIDVELSEDDILDRESAR